MNILVIGGTRFVGRHLVEAALRHNHSLTLFNRGQTNRGLFPDIETIHGDRETDLHKLSGRQWEAVIDTCGYVPRVVRLSAEALREAVQRYVFISTLSIYADFMQVGIDEDYPKARMDDESNENVPENYGALKVLCEQAVESVFPSRALIIRPGLIVGPYDPTDRFTYWPLRVARGGEVLAPVGPDEPCQFIDGSDLAEWTIRMVEQRATGAYNATGPDDMYTFGQLLETCREVSGSEARFVWGSAEFLAEHDVEGWQEIPVWFPPKEGPGLAKINIAKARAAGLTFRPVAETVRDTLEWAKTLPADYRLKYGLDAEKETRVVAALKEI